LRIDYINQFKVNLERNHGNHFFTSLIWQVSDFINFMLA
jgi:hypothetical protein